MKDGKVLVVYFSRTGITRRVGEAIRKELGCESYEIQADRYPAGLRGYFRAVWDVLRGKRVPIRLSGKSPGVESEFDTLVIGTPVWGGRVSAPVRTYLQSYLGRRLPSNRRVAFFVTRGSSAKVGERRVLAQMEKLCGRSPVATLDVSIAELRRGSYYGKIRGFVDELQKRGVRRAA